MTPVPPSPSVPSRRASRWPVVVGLSVSLAATAALAAGYWSWRNGVLPPLPYIAALPEPETPPPDATLLLHAGLQVERLRMAQQASLHIIHLLVDKDELVKGHSLPLPQFVDRIKARGPGLYVVGLDNHTGFLWHDGKEVWFLHSTVVGRRCVIKERAALSPVLGASRYRVAGHLSGNDALMHLWLNARPLPTKLPSA